MITSRPFFVAVMCCAIQSFGQQAAIDTTFLTSAKKNQVNVYTQYMQGQTRLNNGSQYRDYLSRNEEHPYFGIDDWEYGTIVYDEEIYENVPMFYDLSRDEIITEHSLNGAKIELIAEKIQRFTLGEHTFVRLKADSAKVIEPGFYERLYNGKTKVYVRWEKSLQQKVEANDIIFNFEQKKRVYILKDGVYHPVRKKDSVVEVFKDRKQDIRGYMRSLGKVNKSDRETAVAKVAAFYDSETK